MVFSERQKLAEEIIFLSEKRGMTPNDLQICDVVDLEALNFQFTTNVYWKQNVSFTTKPAIFANVLLWAGFNSIFVNIFKAICIWVIS